jgi:AcrR family transcriptional regulator
MDDRLAKSDWIDEGLRTLAAEGANAIKVGRMAERLGVSRGSFYWHFRDIADLREQMLASWRERATEQVIDQLEAAKGAPDRLRNLMRRAFVGKRRLDRAVRAWGAEDPAVAKAVAAVDARRIAYIAKMLTAAGVGNRRASSRAAFMYWAYLGQAVAMDPRSARIPASAMDDIAELFES